MQRFNPQKKSVTRLKLEVKNAERESSRRSKILAKRSKEATNLMKIERYPIRGMNSAHRPQLPGQHASQRSADPVDLNNLHSGEGNRAHTHRKPPNHNEQKSKPALSLDESPFDKAMGAEPDGGFVGNVGA